MEDTISEKDALAGLGGDIPFDELPKTIHSAQVRQESSETPEAEKVYPVGMDKWCKPPNVVKAEKSQQQKGRRAKKDAEGAEKKESAPSIQAVGNKLPSAPSPNGEYLNVADISALKARIFENHEINMGAKDPMLVMVTIMDFYHSRQKREVDELSSRFDKAMAVFENQSKNQLTTQAARDIHRLLREKKPRRNIFLYSFVLSIVACLIGAGFAFYFYKPIQVGSQFLKIYPDLSEGAKKEIINKMKKQLVR